MGQHGRDSFFIRNEGVIEPGVGGVAAGTREVRAATAKEEIRKFRFSRMGPQGVEHDLALLEKVASALLDDDKIKNSPIPSGFTYLGQFVDHDLTLDKTKDVPLGQPVALIDVLQGRSPALDLDNLYGSGPTDADDGPAFYEKDGMHLKVGATQPVAFPPDVPLANQKHEGRDLPRAGVGGTRAERRAPLIPDERNDENLVVAQTHLAFIRFHNAMVDSLAAIPPTDRFALAQAEVVKHYQWLVRHDYLPRVADGAIVEKVFKEGRKVFEAVAPDDFATMPLEFSVGAYRFGHSLVRDSYTWNRAFGPTQSGGKGTLTALFQFSATSGSLAPNGDHFNPDSGAERLPSNWIADWRRLYDFPADAGRADLKAPDFVNHTRSIDTALARTLHELPPGSFKGNPASPQRDRNLAFRNLARGRMLRLASGQQMADAFGVTKLTQDQILKPNGSSADLTKLSAEEQAAFVADTPLWFYILREAEVEHDGAKLGTVGSHILAETFHRAIEASKHSILKDPTWKPTKGRDSDFKMVDLLMFAFGTTVADLAPLG